MAAPHIVQDPDDSRLAAFRGMRSPGFRQRFELDEGIFIVEGIVPIERLLHSSYDVASFLLLPRMWERLRPAITERADDAEVFVAERAVLEAIVGFDLHRGALACARRGSGASVGAIIERHDTLCLVEGLNDGENLGAVARSARAFGVGGLIIDPSTIDPLYRRTIRVSMGEMLFLPYARAERWPQAIDDVRAAGFTVAAFTPAADARSLYEWQPPERVALLFGAEGPGLTPDAQRLADVRVRIPIDPEVDSLNVGHAAAVAFSALARHGMRFNTTLESANVTALGVSGGRV